MLDKIPVEHDCVCGQGMWLLSPEYPLRGPGWTWEDPCLLAY